MQCKKVLLGTGSSADFFDQLREHFRLVDRKLGKSLAVELYTLLVELIDEDAVLAAGLADSRIKTDNPQRAEDTLLLFAVHVGMLSCLDYTLLSLHECGMTQALITLGEFLDLLMPTGADNTALYTHGTGGLEIRKKSFNIRNVRGVKHERAAQTLLTLVLLGKKVVTAVTLHSQLAGSGFSDPLLCAAV